MTNFTNFRATNFDNLPWFTDEIFNHWVVQQLTGAGSSICDIGAGTGIMSEFYSQFFEKVYAIEPSSSMYKKLIQKSNHISNINCINSPSEKIPITDDCVDISVSKSSLHHFNDIKKGILEMIRISSKAIAVIEVIAPDNVCIPFAENILLKKEKGRNANTIFTEEKLYSIVSENCHNLRSMIFDQYIIVDRWLKYSDLDKDESDEIITFIKNQKGLIKSKMQIHEYEGELRMLRRMNLVLGFINEDPTE